jgi:hypothetical protein
MWEHRDLILELVIVGLIGWEIYIAIHGGSQQFEVLKNLQASSAETARTLGFLRTQQQQSLVAQEKSQQEALGTQQKTLTTIGSMNSAMQNQLKLLRKDQQARLAEQAKKPILQLVVGGAVVGTGLKQAITAKELNDTKAVYESILRNVGDATAKLFSVVVSSDDPGVELSTPDTPFVPMHTPSSVRGKAIIVPVERLLPSQWTTFTIVVQHPLTLNPINVTFSASGENLPMYLLGGIDIPPQVLPSLVTPK